MNNNPTHPYALDIQPGTKSGTYQWTIRKNGKLLQRSDKIHRTEDDARRHGEREVEKLFSPIPTTR